MIEYDNEAIVPSYVTEFMRGKTVHNDELLHELEAYAEENSIPIVEPETARFLAVMIRLLRPKRILEVGCAIGYSSILMAKEAKNASIVTLENNADMAAKARENIDRAGLSKRIIVTEADAKDYLSYIEEEESFDVIFLDGPKAHYVYMLDDCVRLLKRGGAIISDNVFYKGMTVDDNHVIRRKITIVKRLRSYIDALMQHPELKTSLLPLGDGVTLSVKL